MVPIVGAVPLPPRSHLPRQKTQEKVRSDTGSRLPLHRPSAPVEQYEPLTRGASSDPASSATKPYTPSPRLEVTKKASKFWGYCVSTMGYYGVWSILGYLAFVANLKPQTLRNPPPLALLRGETRMLRSRQLTGWPRDLLPTL